MQPPSLSHSYLRPQVTRNPYPSITARGGHDVVAGSQESSSQHRSYVQREVFSLPPVQLYPTSETDAFTTKTVHMYIYGRHLDWKPGLSIKLGPCI